MEHDGQQQQQQQQQQQPPATDPAAQHAAPKPHVTWLVENQRLQPQNWGLTWYLTGG